MTILQEALQEAELVVYYFLVLLGTVLITTMITGLIKQKFCGDKFACKDRLKVFWWCTVILVGLFHPLYVTYPAFLSEKAMVIQENGDLVELPYGAIDPFVEGRIVRQVNHFGCSFKYSYSGYTPEGYPVRVVLPLSIPSLGRYTITDRTLFYHTYKQGAETTFCKEAEAVYRDVVVNTDGVLSGVFQWEPPEDVARRRKALMEKVKAALQAHSEGTGVELRVE